MSNKHILSRRTMLRSLTTGIGATVALPIFESMLDDHGVAFAEDGAPRPVRYGVFFWGNGVRPDRWTPNRVGDQWWNDPNEELAPIAENAMIRDRVSILSGFRLLDNSGSAHHKTRAQILTGAYQPSPSGNCCGQVAGASSDWLVRQAWAGQSQLRDAVDVGISQTNKGASNFNVNSGTVFNGNGDAQPLEMSPRAVYDSLFGNGLPEDVPLADITAFKDSRLSMVDLVREDAARLRTKLGAADKQRLDDHLEQILQVEHGIENLDAASACMLPAMVPSSADAYRQSVMLEQDGQPATIIGELLIEKNKVMAELIALALACDLTRVFTFQHHGMQTDTMFWNLPSVSLGSHQSTHDDRNNSPDPQARDFEAVHEIATFVMSQFGVLLQALADTADGTEDLLDNTAIYATSEYGDASTHSLENMAIMVAGGAGGALRTGMHYEGNGRNAVEVPLTLMRAVGLNLDGFGQGVSRATASFDPMLM
ncbi:MAG: DUF1552 domain-containing protein [Myxococcota bacterium]